MHLLDLMEVHATKRAALRPQVAAASTGWSHLGGLGASSRATSGAAGLPWVPARASLPICKLYRGRLRSSVTCRDCGHASNSYDPLETLSLEIAQCTSIIQCLAQFSKAEVRA